MNIRKSKGNILNYTANFAVHLLAILEANIAGTPDEAWRLNEETDRLQNRLDELNEVVDEEEDLSQKPTHLWTEEEVELVFCSGRLSMFEDIYNALRNEVDMSEELPEEEAQQLGERLLRLLVRCLETEEDQPCCFELDEYASTQVRAPGTLGPIKLPPWVQALQLAENQLVRRLQSLALPVPVRAILDEQHTLVMRLKTFLIAETFSVHGDMGKFQFFIGDNWEMWVRESDISAEE